MLHFILFLFLLKTFMVLISLITVTVMRMISMRLLQFRRFFTRDTFREISAFQKHQPWEPALSKVKGESIIFYWSLFKVCTKSAEIGWKRPEKQMFSLPLDGWILRESREGYWTLYLSLLNTNDQDTVQIYQIHIVILILEVT